MDHPGELDQRGRERADPPLADAVGATQPTSGRRRWPTSNGIDAEPDSVPEHGLEHGDRLPRRHTVTRRGVASATRSWRAASVEPAPSPAPPRGRASDRVPGRPSRAAEPTAASHPSRAHQVHAEERALRRHGDDRDRPRPAGEGRAARGGEGLGDIGGRWKRRGRRARRGVRSPGAHVHAPDGHPPRRREASSPSTPPAGAATHYLWPTSRREFTPAPRRSSDDGGSGGARPSSGRAAGACRACRSAGAAARPRSRSSAGT